MKFPDYSINSIMEDVCYVCRRLNTDEQMELWDRLNKASEKLDALKSLLEGVVL